MSETNAKEAKDTSRNDEELIPQDHEKGPGWFLKISYLVITIFCLYYLFTYWNWKSDYDRQQEQLQTEIIESQK